MVASTQCVLNLKTSQQHLSCYINPWKNIIIKASFSEELTHSE